MLADRGWNIYSKLLTLTGVLPLYGPYKLYFVIFLIFQIITFLLCILNINWYPNIAVYGKLGTTSESYQFVLSCIKQEITFFWLFLVSKDCQRALLTIFEHHKNFKVPNKNQFLKNFKIYIICALIFVLNSSFNKYFNVPYLSVMFTNSYGLAILSYEIDFLRMSLLFSFYTGVVSIIADILEKINTEIECICKLLQILGPNGSGIFYELMNLIDKRNELLKICDLEISKTFGLCVLISSGYIMIEFIKAPFYLTADIPFDLLFIIHERIIVTAWFASKAIIFFRVFICNRLGVQVCQKCISNLHFK